MLLTIFYRHFEDTTLQNSRVSILMYNWLHVLDIFECDSHRFAYKCATDANLVENKMFFSRHLRGHVETMTINSAQYISTDHVY